MGRLPVALDLARSLHGAGWRVVVAEPMRRHLAGASRAVARSIQVTAPALDPQRYLQDLARVIADEAITLVVPVSEETMHVAGLAGRIDPAVRLFTMPQSVVLQLHDKAAFAAFAAALDLAVPETCALADRAMAQSLAKSGPVVVKPMFSCSGRGVRTVPQGGALPTPDPADPAIVQRWVQGALVSVCLIAQRGIVAAGAAYRALHLSGSVAVKMGRVDNPAAWAWCTRVVASLRYTGIISFDLVLDDDGRAWGIECNPRATSGLHFITPEAVASAITTLEPTAAGETPFRPEPTLQLFYPRLSNALATGRLAELRDLSRVSDASWCAADPWPFLSMTWTSWPIIRRAWAARTSIVTVATQDVEWTPVRTAPAGGN